VIEAELKARVTDPDALHATLRAASGEPERATYQDAYYDQGDVLSIEGRELRVRTVTTPTQVRTLLTYKGPVLDAATGSKTEAETRVEDAAAIAAILEGLGYGPFIAFTKNCANYQISTPTGRKVLATVVEVPELDGVFLEVETMVEDEAEMSAALDDLRALLLDLDIEASALTTELYTDAVQAARTRGSASQ
jgi:adenylate cyclase, class 2